MGILRSEQNKKATVQSILKAVYSELLDCDGDYAIEYAQWTLDKLLANKKHINEMNLVDKLKLLDKAKDKLLQSKTKEPHEDGRKSIQDQINQIEVEIQQAKVQKKKLLPKNYPDSLSIGDIIHVNYGVGFSGELSDGHYGVVLSRKGSMFLIAPLTKAKQPDRENTVFLNSLGLPGEDTTKGCYINLGQIRYVHFRRIENIIGIEGGRKHLDDPKVQDILTKFNAIIRK